MHHDFRTAPRALAPPTCPSPPGRQVVPPTLPDARRARPILFAAAVATAVAALTLSCATIGHRFPPEKVAGIKNGETTKAQLLGDFGLPYRRGIEDGDSTWTYVYYKVRVFGENLRTRDLYLRFDPDGRVRSYTYNSNLDD
jgi:outer membrane protein assembly factor BamE (lipoprotein component of BamABCDE complex)